MARSSTLLFRHPRRQHAEALLQQSHMIAIELRGVTSVVFSPEQRAAALAAKAPQLSGDEKIDQWFQGMNRLVDP